MPGLSIAAQCDLLPSLFIPYVAGESFFGMPALTEAA
jgi:hypothetical protein